MAEQRTQVIAYAEDLVAQGRLHEAVHEYNKLLKGGHDDFHTLIRIGELHARAGQPQQAYELFGKLAAQNRRDGHYSRAVTAYKRINEIDPSRTGVFEEIADLYVRQGLISEARRQLEAVADYHKARGETAQANRFLSRAALLRTKTGPTGDEPVLSAPEAVLNAPAPRMARQAEPIPLIRTTNDVVVFLCHAHEDKPPVRELYRRLQSDRFQPWLDEEDLIPGQDWQQEIPRAVRRSHVVVVCLSARSTNKAGYLQKEIKFALDVLDEQPEGVIFVVPARLEPCAMPGSLSRLHFADLFMPRGYDKLKQALELRASQLGFR